MLVRNSPGFAAVRQRGLARVRGNPVPGVNPFSALAFDRSGEIALALTTLGSVAEFDLSRASPMANDVETTACAISERLGFRA